MKGQPATMKGRPEWDRHAAGLKLLAQAYGTTFPLPEGASASRVNDKEPIADAAAIASAAEEFKDDLDELKTLPEDRQGRRQEGGRRRHQAGEHREGSHQRWQAGDV